MINNNLNGIKNDDNKFTQEILNLNERLNKYSQNVVNYDLIYLYASPIVNNNFEDEKPISYREEISIILDILDKKEKKFNCLFECMSQKVLREILINKKTKILHISSHGILKNKDKDEDKNKNKEIDKNKEKEKDKDKDKEKDKNKESVEFSLVLENLEKFGEKQIVNEESLKYLLKCFSHKIKPIEGVILSTCYSGGFAELFFKHKPKNVIYIDKKTEIGDFTSVKFAKYFYEELFEGVPVEECYKITIKKLRSDLDILSFPLDRCCCYHFHSNTCLFKDKNTEKMLKTDFHKKYHKKSDKCKCKYKQCHIHDINCDIVKEIKNDPEVGNYEIKESGDIVKICCCDASISHNEISKFKIWSRKDDENEGEKLKNNKLVNIFKYNIKGKIQVNENVCTDFIAKKYYSIIGRKVLVRDIFEFISKNNNDNFFIILFGEKGLQKRNFAESTCVYLLERRIIYKYKIYLIDSEFGYENMKENIYVNENKNSNKKSVKIIKFIRINNTKELIEKIQKINKDFQDYKNLFFIILYDLIDLNEKNLQIKINNIKIECFDSKIKNPFLLLQYYYKLYEGRSLSFNNSLKEKLEEINAKPNQLETIAKLLTFGQKSVEEIISIIEKKSSEIFKEENKEKYSQNYFLSKIIMGLPNILIASIFDKKEINNNNVSTEKLIKMITNNELKYAEENMIFKDKNYFKKSISKALKLYTIILDYYIDKNRNEVNFKDDNIHILFNSYNGNEIWKSHVKELSKNDEINLNDINNIVSDKNFDILKQKENIINIISLVIDDLKNSNLNDVISDNKIIKYIQEILLLFPSVMFFTKHCKNILKKCKYFCEKCINILNKNKLSNINILENNDKYIKILNQFNSLKNKILLFQYSNGDIEKVEFANNSDKNIELEFKFLSFLKFLETKEEKDLKELIVDINERENCDKTKIFLLYYEFAKKYFSKKIIESSEEYLNKAIKNLILYIYKKNNCDKMKKEEELSTSDLIQDFINKIFVKEINIEKYDGLEIKYLFRMIIDFCHIFKETIKSIDDNERNSKIKEKIEYLDIIVKDKSNIKLCKEGNNLKNELYRLTQPDIIMLNSNPIKNQFGLISSGIYAYLNNQYYILKKIKDDMNDEIKSCIRIKSDILNAKNLIDALNKKGEILVIQSDDFTDYGDIVLESDKGISKLLKKEDFINFIKLSPDKIEFKVIIFCFNNSSKFVKCLDEIDYKIDYKYLIYFEYFDSLNIKSKSLIKYNKLCVDFIIDFIKISSIYSDIFKIFKKAKNKFLKNKENISLYDIPCNDFIFLKSKKENFYEEIKYNQQSEEIFLYDPIPDLVDNYKYYNCFQEMENIIAELETKRYSILLCCKRKKNKYIKIGFELIKFFSRHKTFERYYTIDLKKTDFYNLEKIFKITKKENSSESKNLKNNFYFIYNVEEKQINKINFKHEKFEKDFFLLIQDFEHENGDCESDFSSESD